jgi:REP-associated tyrosine transposase
MPDHAHLLVAGGDPDADFKRFARLAKQRSGWRYKRKRGQPLWQEGYHERVLRADEDSPAVARYILGNPLRAGLVRAVEDYPFWGSGTHSRGELLDYVGRGVETR